MKILVVGSGGREHALAWKLQQSPEAEYVFICPGNDGIALEPNIQAINIAANDYAKIVRWSKEEKIDLVVIGPDQALADGLADKLQSEDILAFGPNAAAARIESSKSFAKEVMQDANIPTAKFSSFTDAEAAMQFIDNSPWNSGWAIKADGLALGKGVVVTQNIQEAKQTIQDFMLNESMGAAGKKIVIEERLEGKECSAFYLCDGNNSISLAFACDYKQLLENNQGPNTGGMGCYSPADWLPPDFEAEVTQNITLPLLAELKKRDQDFQGCLFIGLMQTNAGAKVIEFNARFGDPETQVIMPLLAEDLLPYLISCAKGNLQNNPSHKIKMQNGSAVHVVLAAAGYPGTGGKKVRKGDPISIPSEFLPQTEISNKKLFFAGVKANDTKQLETSGGRVLGLTMLAENRENARQKVFTEIEKVQFEGAQKRNDIGI